MKMSFTLKAKNALGNLIMMSEPSHKVLCVGRVGWYGQSM